MYNIVCGRLPVIPSANPNGLFRVVNDALNIVIYLCMVVLRCMWALTKYCLNVYIYICIATFVVYYVRLYREWHQNVVLQFLRKNDRMGVFAFAV